MRVMHITDPDSIDRAWVHAEKWISKALERGNSKYPIDDVYTDICEGKKSLFKMISGNKFCWLVLAINHTSKNRTLVVCYVGGVGVLQMLDDIMNYLELQKMNNHCDYMSFTGRKDWQNVLAKYGWKPLSVTFGR